MQALLNVMDNARKYATGDRRLHVCTIVTPQAYEIVVRDHGPGIPKQERELIFERFHRGKAQSNGSTPGLGLGLYLSRAIMRHHGGDLRYEEAEGIGAQFRFTIPRQEGGGA